MANVRLPRVYDADEWIRLWDKRNAERDSADPYIAPAEARTAPEPATPPQRRMNLKRRLQSIAK